MYIRWYSFLFLEGKVSLAHHFLSLSFAKTEKVERRSQQSLITIPSKWKQNLGKQSLTFFRSFVLSLASRAHGGPRAEASRGVLLPRAPGVKSLRTPQLATRVHGRSALLPQNSAPSPGTPPPPQGRDPAKQPRPPPVGRACALELELTPLHSLIRA